MIFLKEITEIDKFINEHAVINSESDELGRKVVITEVVVTLEKAHEDLRKYLKDLALHEGEMLEVTKETLKSHIFKTNKWFVFADNEECKDGQIQNSIILMKETTLSPLNCQEEKEMQRIMRRMENTYIDEVHNTLGRNMQDFKGLTMKDVATKL